MINETNKIIDLLGGTGALAKLLGVNLSAVSNYRKKGFPARLHYTIASICGDRGIVIDEKIFGSASNNTLQVDSRPIEILSEVSVSVMENLVSEEFELIDPPILVSADKVLDRLGENIADRLYIFSDPAGTRLCLRPDLTIPTCIHYLNNGFNGEKKDYAYHGKVFQFHNSVSAEPNEFSQAGLESIGGNTPLDDEVEIFYRTFNSLKKSGIKELNISMGDISLFSLLIDVLDIPIIWKDQLKTKFWNDKSFKLLLDELSIKKKFDNKLFYKISDLDPEMAQTFVRDTIGLSENQSPVGRSIKEITDRLMKKSQEINTEPLSKNTSDLIRGFLEISDTPIKAIKKLKSISRNIDSKLDSKIEAVSERIEKIMELNIDLKNSVFSLEKGRTVEYYTGFLFDYHCPILGNKINIGGGGRYDDLIKSVSSEFDIPAVGAALNLDRVERVIAMEKSL
jgi:ATP phosphoribosyltransferase regulatory subunit